MTPAEITEAKSAQDFAAAKTLIEEYAAALGVDLCFQNFSEELATLREIYGPPGGCLLLARQAGTCVGCVALRKLDDGVCEMKRLYVIPRHRGLGIGQALAQAVIEHARRLDYRQMVLDTLPSMTEAQALYQSLRFREIERYYGNPLPGVRYLALDLAANGQHTA